MRTGHVLQQREVQLQVFLLAVVAAVGVAGAGFLRQAASQVQGRCRLDDAVGIEDTLAIVVLETYRGLQVTGGERGNLSVEVQCDRLVGRGGGGVVVGRHRLGGGGR